MLYVINYLKPCPLEDQPCLNTYLCKTKCAKDCAKKITEYIFAQKTSKMEQLIMLRGNHVNICKKIHENKVTIFCI